MRSLTIRDQDLLRLLERAAAVGERCPTNIEIASAIGASHHSVGPKALNSLVAKGAIVLQRGSNTRVVTIVSTGRSTAGEIKAPHWRERNKALAHTIDQSRREKALARRAAAQLDMPPPAGPHKRVDRDPCTFCGVRADVGCRHRHG